MATYKTKPDQRVMRMLWMEPIDKIYFVICNSCYWCASYFGIDDLESLSGSPSHVLNCPICNSHNTKRMTIATDESFRNRLTLFK